MAGIVGVRFERAGRVGYYAAAEALAVGDRVAVETPEGPRQGWVVIAPDQVVLDELLERPSVVARRVERSPEADWAGDPAWASSDAATEPAVGRYGLAPWLIGPAQAPPLPPELDAAAGLVARLAASLSPRNREYVERKLRLPALGARIETAQGPGWVVAVQVVRERVTVALDAGGEIVLGGPGLEPVPADELEPRGERGGRRKRRRERKPAPAGGAGATPEGARDGTAGAAREDARERAEGNGATQE
jgi:hypothetical protein